MMDAWALWLVGGLLLAGGAGFFTILWWKIGDQWADAEYKRFGHGGGGGGDDGGGGGEESETPRVIEGFGGGDKDHEADEIQETHEIRG